MKKANKEQELKEIKTKPLFRKWDVFLYAFLVVMISGILLFVLSIREEGNTVVVYYGGMVYAEYPLYQNAVHDIDGHMKLVIEDKKAWVEEPDCPDKVCKGKKISTTNDPIVCSPNLIEIKIEIR